jgi:hypothetical protein
MSIQSSRSLSAYCSGIIPRTHNTTILVDHNAVYNQLSVPKLDGFFINTVAPVRSITARFMPSNTSFVVYYHDSRPFGGMLQMLIFRRSKWSDRLVNLRHSDGRYFLPIQRRFGFLLLSNIVHPR